MLSIINNNICIYVPHKIELAATPRSLSSRRYDRFVSPSAGRSLSPIGRRIEIDKASLLRESRADLEDRKLAPTIINDAQISLPRARTREDDAIGKTTVCGSNESRKAYGSIKSRAEDNPELAKGCVGTLQISSVILSRFGLARFLPFFRQFVNLRNERKRDVRVPIIPGLD